MRRGESAREAHQEAARGLRQLRRRNFLRGLARAPGGFMGITLWMAIGAAIALSLEPQFPTALRELVEKGQGLAVRIGDTFFRAQ